MTVPNAAYSWWTQPLAVSDGPYTWVASIARLGTVRIARAQPSTGSVKWATLGISKVDDHNAPAIALSAAHPHLLAFYTQHGTDNVMRYRTVNRQTLAMGEEQALRFSGRLTYAQVIQSPTQLTLVTRVADDQWHYRTSGDFGATWGDERVLIDADGHGKVYALIKPNGTAGLHHLVFYGHPGHSTYRPAVYGTIDFNSGIISRTDGTVLGDLDEPGGPAIQPTELEQVIAPRGSFKVRVLDVGLAAGRPAIAYAVWDAATAAQNATYKLKVLEGTSWTAPSWSLASGKPFGFEADSQYLGGVSFGRGGQLYTARETKGTWIVQEWQWSSKSARWTAYREIARSSQYKLVRPYVPLNRGPVDVIVQRVRSYRNFSSYNVDLLLY